MYENSNITDSELYRNELKSLDYRALLQLQIELYLKLDFELLDLIQLMSSPGVW